MNVPVPGRIACPGCDKQYPWQRQYAGQRVRCYACNSPLVMPFEPPDIASTTIAEPAPVNQNTNGLDPVLLIPIEDDLLTPSPDLNIDLDIAPDSAPTNSHSLLSSLEQETQSQPPTSPPPPDMPAATSSQDNAYELDLPDEIATDQEQPITVPDGKCPNCGNRVAQTAAICTNCGFNITEGKRLGTLVGITTENPTSSPSQSSAPNNLHSAYLAAARDHTDYEEDHTFTEIWAPIILGGVGLLLILLDSFLILDPAYMFDTSLNVSPRILRLIQRFFAVGFQIPFLFAGIYVVGIFFGTSFSSFGSAILKFVSVALFLNGFEGCLDSLMDRITEGMGFAGSFVTMTLNMGAFFGICAWIFDLDITETFLMWAVSMILPMWLGMFLFAMWFSST